MLVLLVVVDVGAEVVATIVILGRRPAALDVG
jgi:hypothetical protein